MVFLVAENIKQSREFLKAESHCRPTLQEIYMKYL